MKFITDSLLSPHDSYFDEHFQSRHSNVSYIVLTQKVGHSPGPPPRAPQCAGLSRVSDSCLSGSPQTAPESDQTWPPEIPALPPDTPRRRSSCEPVL